MRLPIMNVYLTSGLKNIHMLFVLGHIFVFSSNSPKSTIMYLTLSKEKQQTCLRGGKPKDTLHLWALLAHKRQTSDRLFRYVFLPTTSSSVRSTDGQHRCPRLLDVLFSYCLQEICLSQTTHGTKLALQM